MQKEDNKKRKNLDLILLLSILACSIVFAGSVAAQTGNQAEGSDVDIFIGRIPRLIGVRASEETYTMQSFPDSNYNGEDHLQVRWQSGTTPVSLDLSWMKFQIPGLDETRINFEATLKLTTSGSSVGEPNVAVMYGSNDSWSELSMTWNNQPTYNPVYFQDWQLIDTEGTFFFNVTQAVLWALADGQNTLTLIANTTTDYTTAFFSLKPEIEISYITSDPNGIAFQDGKNPSSFIALYTTSGALNTSNNEFYVGPEGGGMFDFVSNETFTLQFLLSVSANIQGDQGQGIRGVTHSESGLSDEYPVDAGDHVIIYWAPSINYAYALPLISFWGMIGGSLLGCVFLGAGIKRRSLKLIWPAIICLLAAFIFYLIFASL